MKTRWTNVYIVLKPKPDRYDDYKPPYISCLSRPWVSELVVPKQLVDACTRKFTSIQLRELIKEAIIK